LPECRRGLELTWLADPRVLGEVSVDCCAAAVPPPYLTFTELVALEKAGEPTVPQCRVVLVSGRADQVGKPVEGVNRQGPAAAEWAGARRGSRVVIGVGEEVSRAEAQQLGHQHSRKVRKRLGGLWPLAGGD